MDDFHDDLEDQAYFCPSCHTQVRRGATRCPNCHIRLSNEVRTIKFKPRLGRGWLLFLLSIGLLAVLLAGYWWSTGGRKDFASYKMMRLVGDMAEALKNDRKSEADRIATAFGINEVVLGRSFLLWAIINRQPQVVAYLLAAGARTNAMDPFFGCDALNVAIDLTNGWRRPAEIAIVRSLLDSGADVTTACKGQVPIVAAAKLRNEELLQLLLAHGATRKPQQMEAAHLEAKKDNNRRMVDILMRALADSKSRPDGDQAGAARPLGRMEKYAIWKAKPESDEELATQPAAEERARLIKFDKGKLAKHQALLTFEQKTRKALDQAAEKLNGKIDAADQLRKLAASQGKAIEKEAAGLRAMDPKGSASNLDADHDVVLNLLANAYPEAIVAFFAGQTQPLAEVRAEMDKREKKLTAWLEEVKKDSSKAGR